MTRRDSIRIATRISIEKSVRIATRRYAVGYAAMVAVGDTWAQALAGLVQLPMWVYLYAYLPETTSFAVATRAAV